MKPGIGDLTDLLKAGGLKLILVHITPIDVAATDAKVFINTMTRNPYAFRHSIHTVIN